MVDVEDADERRGLALTAGYDGIAAAMLRDEAPDEEAFGLFCAALVDAAIAGDQDVLAILPALIKRLESYRTGSTFSAEWEGRLITLRLVVDLARYLLAVEYARAEHAKITSR